MNCMHWVCYSGYLDLITFLMDKGLSLESPCDKVKQSKQSNMFMYV